MTDYFLASNADISRTHWVDDLDAPPSQLVRVFGRPLRCDELKVSGCYRFVNPSGEVFTVYDWKSTSLYDKSLPSPDEFWASTERRPLSIGGVGETAESFKPWLLAKLHLDREIDKSDS